MIIPKIKLLILDVDGTMTDNGIYVDEKGIESKKYNAKDGVGIYELIKNRFYIIYVLWKLEILIMGKLKNRLIAVNG